MYERIVRKREGHVLQRCSSLAKAKCWRMSSEKAIPVTRLECDNKGILRALSRVSTSSNDTDEDDYID